MTKTAIVYWSGTGNTAAMADFVAEGAKSAGADVSVFTADEFSADKINDFDSLAFGCPSMGCEQLEESEFEPMFDSCKSSLKGKKIAFSAHMAGATASGCALGRTIANLSAQILFATA